MSSARIEEFRLILIALFACMLLGAQPKQAAAAPVNQAEQTAADVAGDIDVQSYRIDAEMLPDTNTLRATAAVTFKRPNQFTTRRC